MTTRFGLRVAALAAVATLTTTLAGITGIAKSVAAPIDPITTSGHVLSAATAADGSAITGIIVQDGRHLVLHVHSTAMHKTIDVNVQRPADTSAPRPILYLLNGSGGGTDGDSWSTMTYVMGFLNDKNANIVQPLGGAWSAYTDWLRDDPVLGRNKWTTFLTRELPPLVDASLGSNGRNAIAGLSMAGESVLALAIHQPGLYHGIASYSGCAQTSDPLGQRVVQTEISTWGHGDPDNMWGPPGSPQWAANDPYVHAEQLRGSRLFISAGSGLPGKYDALDSPYLSYGAVRSPATLANQIILGGLIEAGVNACTHNLQGRLDQLGIPATYDYTPTGTHSWGYWNDAFIKSWPVLAAGLGL